MTTERWPDKATAQRPAGKKEKKVRRGPGGPKTPRGAERGAAKAPDKQTNKAPRILESEDAGRFLHACTAAEVQRSCAAAERWCSAVPKSRGRDESKVTRRPRVAPAAKGAEKDRSTVQKFPGTSEVVRLAAAFPRRLRGHTVRSSARPPSRIRAWRGRCPPRAAAP